MLSFRRVIVPFCEGTSCLSSSASAQAKGGRGIVSSFSTTSVLITRRHCSSSSSTTSDSPSSTTTTTTTPSAKKKTFRTPVRFAVPDSKVTEENLPSAEDLDAMLPTLDELQASLPSASQLKKQYHVGEELGTSDSTTTTTSGTTTKKSNLSDEEPPMPKPLWPDADTPQEILEEEMYGRSDENADKQNGQQQQQADDTIAANGERNPEHVALAWRALFYGTMIAMAGVGVLTIVLGYGVFGVTGLGDIRRRMRDKEEQDVQKMRSQMELQHKEFQKKNNGGDENDDEVKHFTIDLTNPTDLPKQVMELWTAIQTIVEEEGKKEDAKAAAVVAGPSAGTDGEGSAKVYKF